MKYDPNYDEGVKKFFTMLLGAACLLLAVGVVLGVIAASLFHALS